MNKVFFRFKAFLISVAFGGILLSGMDVHAKEEAKLKNGIWVGVTEEEPVIDLSGLSALEAENVISDYVEGLKEKTLLLVVGGGNEVPVKAGELGLTWENPELIQAALNIGKTGNVIERYKTIKDLEYNKKVFVPEFGADKEAIFSVLKEKCISYDSEAVDFSLTKAENGFSVVEGKNGYALELNPSAEIIYNFLANDWNHEDGRIELEVTILEPKGSKEELLRVKDVLGSFSTSFASSNKNRSANIKVGSEKMSGVTLYPGEEFSAIDLGGPFNAKSGYLEAGAYLNGRIVESFGGGICQVTTTLYNAVIRAELEVTSRYNHSMTVSYVKPAEDAAIASSANKDLKFINNKEFPIFIDAYTTDDKRLVFDIYGVETRDPARTIEFESVITEVKEPDSEKIYADAKKPLGYIDIDPSQKGYKSQLWKVEKENGKEVNREKVNTSNYKVMPRTATVGVVTDDPAKYNEIMAAIGTQSIEHVQNVIALLTSQGVTE